MTLKEAATKLSEILRDQITHEARPFFSIAYRDHFEGEIIVYFEPIIKWRILKFFKINSIDDDCMWENYKIILKETGPPSLS